MSQTKKVFIESLKQKNLKWSQQREFILDLFLTTQRHVSTEELYQIAVKKFPQIGYSTVHRTLKLLSECGLASERHFGDRYTRFEKKQKDQHHDHLICTNCGKIIEFESNKIGRKDSRSPITGWSSMDFAVTAKRLLKCETKHADIFFN